MTRLSVNIHEDAASLIREAKLKRGLSITETVRRAFALLAFVEMVQAEGGTLLVREADGRTIREVVVLP